jgi:hypothetical protein
MLAVHDPFHVDSSEVQSYLIHHPLPQSNTIHLPTRPDIPKSAPQLVFGMANIREVLELDCRARTSHIPECHNVDTTINKVSTLLDLGVSDHCFVNKNTFTKYQAISLPQKGNLAGKDSTFTIDGTGTAELLTIIDNILLRIMMSDALHTPQLRSNLILVAKLVTKGLTMSFEGDIARVKRQDSVTILSAIRWNWLYVVPIAGSNRTEVNTFQTRRKAVPFDIWHRRLGHVGTDTITKMVSGGLVDGLEVTGPTEMKALCKDCIYGTHSTHPFPDSTANKTEVLERVYIDLWGPASMQPAGGSKYFMLIINGATSYRSVYFLSSKSADVTLKVFMEFHQQAEQQTVTVCNHMLASLPSVSLFMYAFHLFLFPFEPATFVYLFS